MSNSFVFKSFKLLQVQDGYSFSVDHGLKIVLVNSSFVAPEYLTTIKGYELYTQFVSAYKIAGTDKAIGVVSVEDKSTYALIKTSSNVTYNAPLTDVRGYVVYDRNDNLICFVDLDTPVTITTGTLTIDLISGIFKISY